MSLFTFRTHESIYIYIQKHTQIELERRFCCKIKGGSFRSQQQRRSLYSERERTPRALFIIVQRAEELFQARFNLSYFFLINIERAAAAGDTRQNQHRHRPSAFPQTESHRDTFTKAQKLKSREHQHTKKTTSFERQKHNYPQTEKTFKIILLIQGEDNSVLFLMTVKLF